LNDWVARLTELMKFFCIEFSREVVNSEFISSFEHIDYVFGYKKGMSIFLKLNRNNYENGIF